MLSEVVVKTDNQREVYSFIKKGHYLVFESYLKEVRKDEKWQCIDKWFIDNQSQNTVQKPELSDSVIRRILRKSREKLRIHPLSLSN